MAQAYFSLVTTVGKIKLAQSAAGGPAVVITHFAVGDGNGAETNPTAAATALVREVWRTPVESVDTDPDNPSAVLVTAIIPTNQGGWWMREFGVFDQAGAMIAVAKPVSQYKPTALEGQLEDIRYEFQIIIGETANVTLLVDPLLLFATRAWVEQRKVSMAQSTRLPWLPINSTTVTAPPGVPAVGDMYVIPAAATGVWAGQANKLAEWTGTAWTISTPPDGHGVSLPDGRIFEKIAGVYTEFLASRDWVSGRKVPQEQLMRLPWLPVVSMTVTAPPGGAAVGDIYLIPAGATGAWAANVGKIAEWSGSAWSYTTPPNGHGISLPDGRIFEKIAGVYTEFLASRDWVNNRKTPLGQLMRLSWLPVISMTVTAPPGGPAAGDTYLLPAGPTGVWAGNAGKLAEWSGTAWAFTTPPDGHGISLPDGRIFERIGGVYVEKIAVDAQSGKWIYAVAGGTANALTAALTPAPAAYANIIGAKVRVKMGAADNGAGGVTLNLNGLGALAVTHNDGSPMLAGELSAGSIFEVVYDGAKFQVVSAYKTPPSILVPAPSAPTSVIDLAATSGLFEAMLGHLASAAGGTVQCGLDISFDNGSTWVTLFQDNNVAPGENALCIISIKGGTYRSLTMQTNSTAVSRSAGNTGTVTNLKLRARAASGNVTYSEFWIKKAG